MEVFNNIMIINDDMFSENSISLLNNQSIDAVITDFPYGTLNKRN